MAICSIINAITEDEGFSLSEIGQNAQLCANKLLGVKTEKKTEKPCVASLQSYIVGYYNAQSIREKSSATH